jgi:hypothetical protein
MPVRQLQGQSENVSDYYIFSSQIFNGAEKVLQIVLSQTKMNKGKRKESLQQLSYLVAR